METLDEQLKHMNPIAKRKFVAALKQRALREVAEMQFTYSDLLEVFGLAMKSRIMEAPTKSQLPGKHYGTAHYSSRVNPPGSKLVRRFIRTSGKESAYNRELYKILTGTQYGGEVASDAT